MRQIQMSQSHHFDVRLEADLEPSDVISMGTAGGGEEGYNITRAARAWACAALREAGRARTSSGAARGSPPPAQSNATGYQPFAFSTRCRRRLRRFCRRGSMGETRNEHFVWRDACACRMCSAIACSVSCTGVFIHTRMKSPSSRA